MRNSTFFILFCITCFMACKEPVKERQFTLEVSDVDLQEKTIGQLRLMRNEVYARKGYVFHSEDLNSYFKRQSWYTPNPDTSIELNEEEKAFVDKIKNYEEKLKLQQQLIDEENQLASLDSLKMTTMSGKIAHEGIIDTTYTFSDNYGEYSLMLTATEDNKSVYAYCALNDEAKPKLLWELNDFVNEEEASKEKEISFIKEVISVTDIDNDGLVEPIVVYATEGEKFYEEGRLKILIRYRNSKIVIRHKNAILEEERKTEIEEAFYNLPEELKDKVQEVMNALEENKYAVFAEGVLNEATEIPELEEKKEEIKTEIKSKVKTEIEDDEEEEEIIYF